MSSIGVVRMTESFGDVQRAAVVLEVFNVEIISSRANEHSHPPEEKRKTKESIGLVPAVYQHYRDVSTHFELAKQLIFLSTNSFKFPSPTHSTHSRK